jgi:hypothetical protein
MNTTIKAPRVWLSFGDLNARGIVKNWQTLGAWQRDPNIRFPKGVLFGPSSRRWSEDEINEWLAARPAEWPQSAP